MKKTLLAIAAIICITACTKTEYCINGQVDNSDLNGTTVYIAELLEGFWQTIDSTVIADGKFAFTGKNDSARVAFLRYEYLEDSYRQLFILEPGNINVNIDAEGEISVTGTEQNKILNAYNEERKILFKKWEEIGKALKERNASTAEIATENKKIFEEWGSLIVKYCTEYANTAVGNYLFLTSYYYLPISEKETVIATFNAETKSNERIEKVIEKIEIEKRTAVGALFTDFTQMTPTGEILSLSSLVGKTDYVLIDFWASWCGPCIRSFPELKAFYDTYKGTQIEILGVSLDDNENSWLAAIEKHELPWLHVSDLKGWSNEAARLYAVSGIPHTVLIDRDGKIVGHKMSIAEMEELLTEKSN